MGQGKFTEVVGKRAGNEQGNAHPVAAYKLDTQRSKCDRDGG